MNDIRRVTLSSLTALVLLWSHPAAAEPVKAVASFSILGDMVRNVGGELVALHVIVGANGDAHVYEPKPEDARAVAAADVVFVNGLGFEGWMERVVEAAGSNAPVIEASAGIATIAFAGDGHHEHEAEGEAADHQEGHEAVDPHGWQSVANAVVYVGNIAKALCAADKDNCAAYQGQRETLRRCAWRRSTAKSKTPSPEPPPTGAGSSAATMRSATSPGNTASPSSPPKAYRRNRKPRRPMWRGSSNRSDADKAAAIFVENITDRRLMEQIGRETGMQVGGELFSDALSPQRGPAPTYIDMMRYNARAIVAAIAAGS